MDDALLELILQRLDSESLDPGPTALLLAACEGTDQLQAAMLQDSPRPERVRTTAASENTEPAGAWLNSITVRGFRGVGPECTLPVEPGPGLTLVVGRNGSGKSSFAEGLEALLTGSLRRWEDRSSVWKESWRNLHSGSETWVAADLSTTEGSTHLKRTWTADADFAEGEATMQIHGHKRTDLSELGWEADLEAYRPLLSHAELEAFFGRPTDLYELLSQVLGLDDLVETAKRLSEARKEAEGHLSTAKKAVPGITQRLEAADDERAKAVLSALSVKGWDLDRVEATITGGTPTGSGSELEWLKRIVQLSGPDVERCSEVSDALRQAAVRLETIQDSEAGRARQLAELLEAAVEHSAHSGPTGSGDCPVCGTAGALDADWVERARSEIEELRRVASEATEALRLAAEAVRSARSLLSAPPRALESPVSDRVETQRVEELWQRWSAVPESDGPDGLRRLADHLESAAVLRQSVEQLTAAASGALQSMEDHWAPLALEIATWLAGARRGKDAASIAKDLKAAENWLKAANDAIRNARLAPITDEARAVWAQLRQESNVELGEIRLAGTGPKRHLQIEVSVDGSGGAALGVMSQGEVNALALSIFLPRATLPASPFRFLVIDDPVQAMDPAKVDGFARVIQRFAQSRQVIVFTHDDRLPEAVRRLDIASTILEVTRQADSVVEVRSVSDPSRRALEDAGALCADDSVPHKVAARVVPNLCRIAAESALISQARRRLLGDGMAHSELDRLMGDAKTFNQKAALGLFGDPSKGGEVLPRLNRMGSDLADTFQALNKNSHSEHPGDLRDLVGRARKLVHEINVSAG